MKLSFDKDVDFDLLALELKEALGDSSETTSFQLLVEEGSSFFILHEDISKEESIKKVVAEHDKNKAKTLLPKDWEVLTSRLNTEFFPHLYAIVSSPGNDQTKAAFSWITQVLDRKDIEQLKVVLAHPQWGIISRMFSENVGLTEEQGGLLNQILSQGNFFPLNYIIEDGKISSATVVD